MNKKVLVLTRNKDYPSSVVLNDVEYPTIVRDVPAEDIGHCKGVLNICNEYLVGVVFDMPSRQLSVDELLYIWVRVQRTWRFINEGN